MTNTYSYTFAHTHTSYTYMILVDSEIMKNQFLIQRPHAYYFCVFFHYEMKIYTCTETCTWVLFTLAKSSITHIS